MWKQQKKLITPGSDGYSMLSVQMYFEPSFPEESNAKNRQLILEALKEISTTDKTLWRNIVENIISSWGGIHQLSNRHIPPPEKWDKRFYPLQDKVMSSSKLVMSAAMREILEQTEKGVT